MYLFEAHLKDGSTRQFQHHDQNASVEMLKRVAENALGGVAAHMIIKVVSKGRAK